MKYDLAGDLSKDRFVLSGIHDVSAHLGCKTWGIRGPRPSPGCISMYMDLVATVVLGSDRRTGSAAYIAWIGFGYYAFHFWILHAALEDFEAYRSYPRGAGRLS